MEMNHNDLQQNSSAEDILEKPASESVPSDSLHRKSRGEFRPGTMAIGILIGVVGTAAVLLLMTQGRLFALMTGSGSIMTSQTIQKVDSLTAMIDNVYYEADAVTDEQLQEGLYAGLIDALDDPYSVYYTAEDLTELGESISGTFSGIGAYVSLDETTGYPKIAGVIEGSPAEEAGLLSDDLIYEVEGESMQGLDLDVAVSRIRGEEGTSVTITIYRDGEYLEFDITRAAVESVTVAGEMLDEENGIGYIQISEFDDVTPEQFVPVLTELMGEGMQGLILDLRDNPGGTVTAVTSIAQYLIPEGLVFYMESPDGTREDYTATGENEIGIPIAVLVNGNSASASEILSSAIQDSGAGIVVGTQTYGKGVVQTIYTLTDGTGVKLTTASYYTRNGNDINGVGVAPDIEVELDTEAYLEDGTDSQLDAAIEQILEELQ